MLLLFRYCYFFFFFFFFVPFVVVFCCFFVELGGGGGGGYWFVCFCNHSTAKFTACNLVNFCCDNVMLKNAAEYTF